MVRPLQCKRRRGGRRCGTDLLRPGASWSASCPLLPSLPGTSLHGPATFCDCPGLATSTGEVWDLLAWRSPHPHAPVTVAASPHYWAQLDVPATVRSLLRNCPRFWTSDELHQTLRDGQLVRLDSRVFAQELLDLLPASSGSRSGSSRGNDGRDRRNDSSRDWRAAERLLADVGDWLGSTPHAPVCRRLMHLLPEPALLSAFRQTVKQSASDSRNCSSTAAAEATAARLVFGTQWRTLDDLLLACAMAFRAVDLWQWLQEDSTSLQVQPFVRTWPCLCCESRLSPTVNASLPLSTVPNCVCTGGKASLESSARSGCFASTLGCAAPSH
jgi:hypothetical protein